jgi:hypothetical protein
MSVIEAFVAGGVKAQTAVDAELVSQRVDALADERERRRFSPLGVGYYTADVRREAKAVAASMLAAAAAHGITLGVLDMVTDLAADALDAASISLARKRFLGERR